MAKRKSKPALQTGPISMHPKGFGFVRREEGPDIFIPRHATMDAVDGDLVEIEVNPIVSPKGPEGEVIAILKRSRTHLAGTVVAQSGPHYTVYAPLIGPDKPVLVQAKGISLKPGDRIICKVLNWTGPLDLVEATLDRTLGHISDPSVDVAAAIEEFELPDGFTQEALDETKRYSAQVTDWTGRLDLTSWETVTIDPDTARDFDDAISLTQDSNGHFHLGVHIADVAHYVKPGMHLDQEAATRCNSIYLPGTCIPMLPEALSNELCSLKPNVVRLTQSVLATFDAQGNLLDTQIQRTAIKSKQRFTYREAFEILEKKQGPHLALLERMVHLCKLLKQKRFERGSIDFAMHDSAIRIDANGMPTHIERVEYDITHQMIEEFMLKANELVATYLQSQGKSLIYRVHEEPSSDSFEDFYSFARALGFKLPGNPKHTDIQKLFQSAKDSPLLPQLSVSFIRSMRLAQYSPDNIGHYGLALEHYSHFTSPIRRYTDLIIQRLLFNELSPSEDLEAIAAACSEKERTAMRAENSVALLKKLRLAKTHFDQDPSRIYPATITKIKPFVLFCEIPLFDLEASLHVSELGNDFFEYNPKLMAFRGKRTGQTYTIGQTVSVRLEALDFVFQKSTWHLVSPIPKKKKKFK